MVEDRNKMLDEIKEYLCQAQNRMKIQAERHTREVEYQVGDMVFLNIQPYRLCTLASRVNQKLSLRSYGTYEMGEKVGSAAYKLKLPASSVGILFSMCHS